MAFLISKVRDFFGMDLPVRTIPLNFVSPNITGKFTVSKVDDDDFNDDLAEFKDMPLAYLKCIMEEIKHLNRCALKPRHRRKLNRDILELYFPMAMSQLAKHAKTGGVPEPEERKLVLMLVIEIAQTLIVSCQILFAHYYQGSQYQYARAHKVVQECASRIMELLLLKQQARALRYQVLENQDWVVANTLFYVMFCYDDVMQPLSTLKKELEIGRNHNEVSLYDQFVLLHIISRFDVLRWPTHIQWVIASYVRSVENAVQIRLDDGHFEHHELIAYCYGGHPAEDHCQTSPSGPAMILHCQTLIDAIHKDCMGMMRAKKHNDVSEILPRFARLPEEEHFVIFDQLVRGLGHPPEVASVKHAQAVDDLRIFVGFAEVYGLLHHRQSIYGSEERLVDMLARRSALIAEDNVATHASVWTLVLQNDQMIRLSTQETDFTTAMRIGSLLACGLGENINRPSLAVVSRIFRPSPKVVHIDIHRIADYAEPVTLSINQPLDQPVAAHHQKPALLVYDHKRPSKWGLMFPPQDVVLSIDHFAIHRRKHALPIHLNGMRNATNDFYLFSTALTSEQLGIVGEPDYPTPPAKKHHSAGWLL